MNQFLMLLLAVCLWKINVIIIIIIIIRRGRVGPLKAVVKLFKVWKIGAKLIFFSQISTPRINNTRSRRCHTYIRGFFQRVFRRGRGCLHILSFFLSACCGQGDRNESTNISISKLIIGTKQNVLIWSAYYQNKSRTFQYVPKLFKIELERFGVF